MGKGQDDKAGPGALPRREFMSKSLSVTGWGTLFGVGALGSVETLRFFSPTVVFRPPTTFEVGSVEDFLSEGTPDDHGIIRIEAKWKKEHRFFIVREPKRLYALFAQCTHLGCTINWFPSLNVFKCPCHGSQFYSNGENFAGPAPRALDRLKTTLNAEGNIVVDTGAVYTRDRFEEAGAYVEL